MSGNNTGPANSNPHSGARINVPRYPSMNPQSSAEQLQLIRARQLARNQPLRRSVSDLYPHPLTRPLARVVSTSTIEPNSLGRRRREVTHLGSQYTMNRGSRSEGNLAAPGAASESDELSDTEFLDGRRVRAKYASTSAEQRDSNWSTAMAEQNNFGDLVWRNDSADGRDSSMNIGASNATGFRSSRTSQPQRTHSQDARPGFDQNAEPLAILTSYIQTGRNGERNSLSSSSLRTNASRDNKLNSMRALGSGDGSPAPGMNSPRPVPPRKSSDWEPARSRGNSSASNKMPAPSLKMDQGTLMPSNGNPSTSRTAFREMDNPTPGRLRAQSRSSNHREELSSSRGLRHPAQSQQAAEIILPRWQLDAEVTFCPICRTQFSKYLFVGIEIAHTDTSPLGFFVRKHHCR